MASLLPACYTPRMARLSSLRYHLTMGSLALPLTVGWVTLVLWILASQ